MPTSDASSVLFIASPSLNLDGESLRTLLPGCNLIVADGRSAKKMLRRASPLSVLVIAVQSQQDSSIETLQYLRNGLRDKRTRTVVIMEHGSLSEELVQEGLANTCVAPDGITAASLATQIKAEIRTHSDSKEEMTKRNAQVSLLTSLAKFSKNETSLDECLQSLTNAIREVLQAQVCHVINLSEDACQGDSVKFSAASHIQNERAKSWATTERQGGPTVTSAASELASQICIDPADDLLQRAAADLGVGVKGSLAVPIPVGDTCIAVILCLLAEAELDGVSVEMTRMIEKSVEQFGILLERRRAEDQLADQYTRLKSTLAELKQAQDNLVQSEKMASIGQLAAGIAHEINNPIAFIKSNFATFDEYLASMFKLIEMHQTFLSSLDQADRGHTDSLKQELGDYSKSVDLEFLLDDIRALVVESQDGVHRVAEIVNDLKTYARQDNQDPTPASINDGIRNTLKIARPKLSNGIQVELNLEDLPPVMCHAGQLNQVFMNLIVNAADAMDGRGMLTITTCKQESHVVISIADTGPGVPKDVIGSIFDPFYTTKPVGEGTGLGLSISYGIVERHHGTLVVSSQPGDGAVFTITLPIDQPVSAAA